MCKLDGYIAMDELQLKQKKKKSQFSARALKTYTVWRAFDFFFLRRSIDNFGAMDRRKKTILLHH